MFVVVLAACGLAGLVGRFWPLALPLLVVPLLYLGLGEGWRGYGLGDAWQAAMMLYLALAVGITIVGAAAGAEVRRRRGSLS